MRRGSIIGGSEKASILMIRRKKDIVIVIVADYFRNTPMSDSLAGRYSSVTKSRPRAANACCSDFRFNAS
jgi:hypothetical protein